MTVGDILLLIWLVPAIPFGIFFGRMIYGKPGERRRASEVQAQNPRSATLCGITSGLCWPVMLIIALLDIFIQWIAAGAPDR